MQNPPQAMENSTPPMGQGGTNAGNQTQNQHSINASSHQPHPNDGATNPSPNETPSIMMPMPPPPPPPPQLHDQYSHMMPPPMTMMMQPPQHPHFHPFPHYLNHHPSPSYGYPFLFPGAPPPPPPRHMSMPSRQWSTDLCDCFSDVKNCFITTYCPYLTFGQVSEILNEGQTPWWEGAVIYMIADTITMSAGTFLCAWVYRSKMRRKHSLEGSHLWDLLVTCLCTRLTLCQLYRQLNLLGYNVPLGWKANKDKHGHNTAGNHFQVVPPTVESGMFR